MRKGRKNLARSERIGCGPGYLRARRSRFAVTRGPRGKPDGHRSVKSSLERVELGADNGEAVGEHVDVVAKAFEQDVGVPAIVCKALTQR